LIEDRRARLVAGHELVHQIDDLLAICFVRKLTAADGSHDCLVAPAKMFST
jgi:hypothetical protein